MKRIKLMIGIWMAALCCCGCGNEIVDRAKAEMEGSKKVSEQNEDGSYIIEYTEALTGAYKFAGSDLGGYLEQALFCPVKNKKDDHGAWKHYVVVVFEKEKPVKIRIYMAQREENDNLVFDEEVRKDIVTIISSVTGDREASEKFVKELRAPDGSKGQVGKTDYRVRRIEVDKRYQRGYVVEIG